MGPGGGPVRMSPGDGGESASWGPTRNSSLLNGIWWNVGSRELDGDNDVNTLLRGDRKWLPTVGPTSPLTLDDSSRATWRDERSRSGQRSRLLTGLRSGERG